MNIYEAIKLLQDESIVLKNESVEILPLSKKECLERFYGEEAVNG